jgi:alpha-glucosidase (family GH31 glycosyl hydrolase)
VPAVTIPSGRLAVSVDLDPFSLVVRRDGHRLLGPVGIRAWEGIVADEFIQLTEGVIAQEDLGDPVAAVAARHAGGGVFVLDLADGAPGRLEVAARSPDVVTIAVDVPDRFLRVGLVASGHPEQRFAGLGARHGVHADQAGRDVRLGADRRYTGPDCPLDMLELGGIPQGDYAPVPWLLASRGWAAWLDTEGQGAQFALGDELCVSGRTAAGPLRVHVFGQPTPAARLRAFLRATGLPMLLPEWGYGHWKSRDVYEHQRDVEADFDGYREHRLPLDAIVLDSPWETQYNTWQFNPHQFPDAPGLIARMRAGGVRTVVWVTPWVNVESIDGQRPPDAESERLSRLPAANYAQGAARGHFLCGPDGEPYVGRWWMGTGSLVDFTSAAAEVWWREQAKAVLRLGVQGIKADDGEGFYVPDDARFADGSTGAQRAWGHGLRYRRSMQRALDEVHPGEGVLFGRPGWTGQQAVGATWGGDQPSDFWSLRTLVAATLSASASGFSNWSHDIGGYLGAQLMDRCPKELLIRWVQFGCFTPLMQAHGRFAQEAWTYDAETLALYREYLVRHERLVPYVRAAARTAARCGLPVVRPLLLADPADARGWSIADAYGYGPSLWVAPVLEDGAREVTVDLPRGDWIDYWTRAERAGGGEVTAPAPLARIPVWVRRGALIVTYPAGHVAAGLGDVPERERPLEATLWGEPPCGRATARLADGTVVRWTRGDWSVTPSRPVDYRIR